MPLSIRTRRPRKPVWVRTEQILLAVSYLLLVAIVAYLSWSLSTQFAKAHVERCVQLRTQLQITVLGAYAASDPLDRPALDQPLTPIEQSLVERTMRSLADLCSDVPMNIDLDPEH